MMLPSASGVHDVVACDGWPAQGAEQLRFGWVEARHEAAAAAIVEEQDQQAQFSKAGEQDRARGHFPDAPGGPFEQGKDQQGRVPSGRWCSRPG